MSNFIQLKHDRNLNALVGFVKKTLTIAEERKNFESYILKDRGQAYLSKYWNDDDKCQDYADTHIQEAWEAWMARANHQ